MKTTKKLLLTAMMLLATASLAFSQKSNVKAAERIAKSKNADFQEARSLVQQALENPETKGLAQTFYVGGFVEQKNFESENFKQLDGVEPNKEVMNKALLDMFTFYQQALEADKQPNEKGKIKPAYTKDILKAYESNLLYFINAGGYYFENKQYDKALEAFTDFKTIKSMPTFEGTPLAAVDTNSMEVDFFSVITAYQAGKKEDAIKYANEIKSRTYRQNDVYQILAQTLSETGDTVQYVNVLKEGLGLFPEEPFYSVSLINTYIASGDTEKAITTIKQAIEKSPKNAQLYDVLGKLLEDSKPEEAISYFEKSIEVDPEYIDSYYDLGRVYYNQAVTLKSSDRITPEVDAQAKVLFEKALPYLEKAYSVKPEMCYYVLGNVYYNLHMNEKYDELMKKHGGEKQANAQ